MSTHRSRLPLALAALAASVAAGCSQKAPTVNVTNDPTGAQQGVVVSGRGRTSGAPDTVSVSIGVSIKRPAAPAAIADGAASAQRVIDALKGAGVAEKDIRTTNYSLNQEFRYPEGGSPVPDGFRVSNQVIAKIRTMDTVGAVIDAATAAGGDDAVVQGLSFSLDDDTEALATAREAAYADAKSKAEQFAELSGRKLGAVVSIDHRVTPPTTTPVGEQLAYARDAAAMATPVQPGEVDTEVTVDVRWSFADR